MRVPAFPERVFDTTISWVAPALDPNTRRLPVRAEIANPDGALKPLMFANFSIVTGPAATAPAVPPGAIVYEGDRARVWVSGRRHDRRALVTAGRTEGGMVEIHEGPRPGNGGDQRHAVYRPRRRLRMSAHFALFTDRAGGAAISEPRAGCTRMNAVIAFALRQRRLVVVLLLLVFAISIASFIKLNIEAYPDPVPPLVDIITQSRGQSAEEMERYITIPIEIQMAGIPHVTTIRTISLFGLSDVKVQFTYDFTYEQAQQWVINRLSHLERCPTA